MCINFYVIVKYIAYLNESKYSVLRLYTNNQLLWLFSVYPSGALGSTTMSLWVLKMTYPKGDPGGFLMCFTRV